MLYLETVKASSYLRTHVVHITNITPHHGLRTPNEGINQRNLKIWADVADKICFGRKSNPNPKFLGTAKASFVFHICPNFQISLIYAFIGSP